MRYLKALLLVLITLGVSGQAPQDKLYVLNEGTSTLKGSVGVIDLSTKTYTHIDSIQSYGNDLVYDEQNNYLIAVAGDITIYDAANNYQLVKTITGINARKAAIYRNNNTALLLVTSTSAPYFYAYDISNNFTQVQFTLDNAILRTRCEGILVANNKAFIAQQGTFSSYDSTVVVIDLINKSTDTLLTVAKNPGNLILVSGNVYVQCKDYGQYGLIVGKINPNTYAVSVDTTKTVSYGGFVNYKDSLIIFNYNPTYTTSYVASYDINTKKVDTTFINAKAYAISYYAPYDIFFFSLTDYMTYGKVYSYSNGTFKDTISTHISPRVLLFVPQNPANIKFVEKLPVRILGNPSPELVVSSYEVIRKIEIYSITGELVYSGNVDAIHFRYSADIPEGLYIVKVYGNNKMNVIKWIKN